MKKVNGNAFCKQNGILFSSFIHRLFIQHHNRILWRDEPEFRSEMFVVFYSNGIRLLFLHFYGLEFLFWVTVVIENGKNAFKNSL